MRTRVPHALGLALCSLIPLPKTMRRNGTMLSNWPMIRKILQKLKRGKEFKDASSLSPKESEESTEIQEQKNQTQIPQGLTLTDSRYCAFNKDDVVCPVCDGHGKLMVDGWKFPRPCTWCGGVGQMHKNRVPDPMAVQMWVNQQ